MLSRPATGITIVFCVCGGSRETISLDYKTIERMVPYAKGGLITSGMGIWCHSDWENDGRDSKIVENLGN